MDPKRQKQAKPSLEVPAEGPQKTGCGRKSFLRGWKRGIDGKASSVEGVAPEKCATLGIIRGRGPQAQRSGRGRVATFSGATPSAKLQVQHSPSSGVSAYGPQTPKTGENVAWGADGWTSNAEKRGNLRKMQTWRISAPSAGLAGRNGNGYLRLYAVKRQVRPRSKLWTRSWLSPK